MKKFSQSQLENGKNILNDWINRLPSKSSFITEAFLSDNTFKISWRSGEIYEKAYFYPEQNGLINYSSNQILGKNKALISIFAGSRKSEIDVLTPILLKFIKK